MAYTAVKLADVQKAITAVKTAQQKYDTAVKSSTSSKDAVAKALKARDDALKKVEDMRSSLEKTIKEDSRYKTATTNLNNAKTALDKAQSFLDSGDYLKNNTAYQNALKAFQTADQKLNDFYRSKDSGDYLKSNSTYQNAVKAYQAAEQKLQQAYQFKDSGDFLKNNGDYQTSLKRVSDGERDVQNAQRDVDRASDRDRQYYQNKLDAANKELDKRRAAVDTTRERAEKYAESLITAADKARSQAETNRNNAEASASKAIETAISNADRARATAESNVNKAQQTAQTAAQTAINTAQRTFDTTNSNLDKIYNTINNEKQTAINTAQKAFETAESTYNKANDTYQNLVSSFDGLLSQRNEAIGNVNNYINDIRGSLGDVTTKADANAVKTLLGQIQTAVNGTKIDDLIKTVNPSISQIDPLKMSNIPTVNIPKANVDYFPNIDRTTGLPVLNQDALDKVLNKYKSNSLTSDQYRDNYNAFGWNVKSDGSSVSHGTAIVGLDQGTIVQGMGGGTPGIVRAGTNQAATDDDFKKAAQQLGIDINQYYTTKETVGAYGQKGTQKVLDRQGLFDEINNQTKDFYVVANALDRTGFSANQAAPHAAILFKADGAGNLVPVVKPDGQLAANYYSAVGVSHAGWRGQLAELAPIISIASMAFLPGISSALSQSIASIPVGTTAAIAPTAFTVGVPAATATLGSVIGATGVSALTSSIINGGMAALTGGDVGKAMQSGLVTGAVSANTSDIAQTVMGGGETGAANIKELARITNLSVAQVEKTIASGVTSGLVSTIADPENIGENIASSILGNFASEEAKNFITGRIDPKSLNGLETFASNAAGIAATAAARGDDVIDALGKSAQSLAVNSAIAQYKYQPLVGTGASGFPIQEEIENYYNQLVESDFDETIEAQIKQIFPNISDADAKAMAMSFTGNIAAEQIAGAVGDTSEDTLDFLRASIAGEGASFGTYGIPKYLSEIKELQPTNKESGSGITKVVDKEGITTYQQTIFGKTPDGKDYSYTAIYDPDAPEGRKISYEVGAGLPTDATGQGGQLPPVFVSASSTRPDFTAEGTPGSFSIDQKQAIGTTYNFNDSLSKQFSSDPQIMAHYINEANKILGTAGITSPSQEDISKTAFNLLKMDVATMFPGSGGGTGATTVDTTGGTTSGTTGGTTGGIPGGITGGIAGGTEGGFGGTGTGAGTGTGTGDGTGDGTGAGGDGTGAAAQAAAQKAALQKRQQTYKTLMGIAALPLYQQEQAKSSGPSEAFYYGKEFNAPTQQIGSKGELIQQQYQPLSVTLPGKEPEFLKPKPVVPGEKTEENDISSLIGSGEDIDLNELIDILGRGSYG